MIRKLDVWQFPSSLCNLLTTVSDVSQQLLEDLLKPRRLISDSECAPAASIIHDILAFFASFPFQPAKPSRIDRSGLTCALLIVSRRDGFSVQSPAWSVLYDSWGPHHGWFVSQRVRNELDFRRLLFRSIAVHFPSKQGPLSDRHPWTRLHVPRFFQELPHSRHETEEAHTEAGGSNGDEDNEEEPQQVVFIEEEDERTIDMSDVLAWCPSGWDNIESSHPLRESYNTVLSDSDGYTEFLHEMRVPQWKLELLDKMLRLLKSPLERSGPGRFTHLNTIGVDDGISWISFNQVFHDHEVSYFIVESL